MLKSLRSINKFLSLSSKSKASFSYQIDDSNSLTEDQLSIQKLAFDFAKQKLEPNSIEWDRKHHFPIDIVKEAAISGFGGIYASTEFGGCGLKRLDASIIFEALSTGDVPIAALLSVHNMCAWILDEFGNIEQKKKWLNRVTSMEILSSYCLTEPNSGSDSAAMKTFAKADEGDYVINGSKCFITGGSVSDIYIVMCLTAEKQISSIVVEKGTKGLSFGKLEDKMGWNASPTAMVLFDDCRVPKSHLLSNPGDGFKIAMKGLDGGRINIGSCSLGGALFAYEKAVDYLKTRKQFGKTLSQFQHLQFQIAEMYTYLNASRLMIRNAARLIDANHPDKTIYSAMAKNFSTDKCFDIVNKALQMHGGYGYLAEYGIEKVLRDLRVNQILEGTNEIMKLIVSRKLLKDSK